MDELEERKIKALESIANSLSTLAEDTKANKELKIEISQKVSELEKSLINLKDDPFGLNERN